MSFRNVNKLRKEKQPKEALTLARQLIKQQPDNIWALRAISWALIDMLKIHSDIKETRAFIDALEEFSKLGLPEEEKIAIVNAGFWITKMLYQVTKAEDLESLQVMWKYIREINYPKPSEFHSTILNAVLKVSKNWNDFLSFIEWWNLENLREEDFKEGTSGNGKKFISLAERTYITYAKKILAPEDNYPENNGDKINLFIDQLEEVCEQHPEFSYASYYLAKIYLYKGNFQKFEEKFIPFARKKANNFWIWDILAESAQTDKEKIACYSKALSLPAPEEMLVKVREKFAITLLKEKFYEEAKTETILAAETRTKKGWRITPVLEKLIRSEWFGKINETKDKNRSFYKHYLSDAENLIYNDIKPIIAIVYHVKPDRKLAFFIHDEKTFGNFKFDMFGFSELTPGEFLEIRYEKIVTDKGDYLRVLTAQRSDKTDENLLRIVSGKIKLISNGTMGFIDDVFLDKHFIQQNNLLQKIDEEISVKAVPSFDRKKDKWGWKALEIVKN